MANVTDFSMYFQHLLNNIVHSSVSELSHMYFEFFQLYYFPRAHPHLLGIYSL